MTRHFLTAKQKAHILKLYAEEGTKAAYAVAPSYGVTRAYVRKMAHYNGVKAKQKPVKPKKVDHRWEWAIARGPVIAGGYWQSTKSPVHLFPKEYESEEVAKHLAENALVDAAMLSAELRVKHMHPMAVAAYQRRLGVRKIAENNPRDRR